MKSAYILILASVLTIAAGLWWLSTQPLPEPTVVQPEAGGPEPGSFDWCEAMVELPGDQWTEQDTLTFAEYCLLD